MDRIALHIEALIFSAPEPITSTEIKNSLEDVFETEFAGKLVDEALTKIEKKYTRDDFSFALEHINGGYVFMTKVDYHNVVGSYLRLNSKKRLSRSALETLSIVAYKQPVTKGEVERIRGVSSDYSIQKLLEKELVDILGRSDGPGRPLLYGTGAKFMNYFGLNDLSELPKLKDISQTTNQIGGEASDIEISIEEPQK